MKTPRKFNKNAIKEFRREARIHERIKNLLRGRIAHVYPDIIETDKGPGLVCQLIRDEIKKNISPNISCYLKNGGDSFLLLTGLNWLAKRIIMRDLFFLDFNRGNFAVQTRSDNSKFIWLIDIKSLNRAGFRGFLHLERIFSPLARIIMYRRLRRLYRDIGLKFPDSLNKLCRKKFFSNFIVKIRL